MIGRGDPFYLKFWVNRPPLEQDGRFWTDLDRACSASAVTPSEKRSIDANSKSTTRFPMSLRWSSYVAPKSPKGGLKNEKRADLRKKLDFAWRKSATKFVCVKTVSGKVVKALIGSTNPAKMIGGGDPLYLKFWIIVTAFVRNRRFPLYFRS